MAGRAAGRCLVRAGPPPRPRDPHTAPGPLPLSPDPPPSSPEPRGAPRSVLGDPPLLHVTPHRHESGAPVAFRFYLHRGLLRARGHPEGTEPRGGVGGRGKGKARPDPRASRGWGEVGALVAAKGLALCWGGAGKATPLLGKGGEQRKSRAAP